MAYTNTWDDNFPPDTQPAKLLGQDIRNLKTDIQERFANFYCNTLANRPTPEASFVGLMFFATDTGVVYRWNGLSWDVFNFPGKTNTFSIIGSAMITGAFNLTQWLAPIDCTAIRVACNIGGVVGVNVNWTNGSTGDLLSGDLFVAGGAGFVTAVPDQNQTIHAGDPITFDVRGPGANALIAFQLDCTNPV